MKAEFVIKNYRCFSDEHPLEFTLEDGFTGFVGPNNSGKSSILKFFFEFRALWESSSHEGGGILASLRDKSWIEPRGTLDPTEVFSDLNKRDLIIDIMLESDETTQSGIEPLGRLRMWISRSDSSLISTSWVSGNQIDTRGKGLGVVRNVLRINNTPVADLNSFFEFNRLLASMMYVPSFRNAINIGGNEGYFDILVGTSFIEKWHEWKTGKVKAHKQAIQRVTQDIKQLFGYRSLEITASKEHNTLQIYANGKDYRLGELGGGIAQFILVLGNAVLRSPSFIMIDEPELNLHPALQLQFLTTLGSYSQHGVLFATHSLGLARSGANRVYLTKQEMGATILQPFEDAVKLSDLLGQLRFGGLGELGFDRILLVEGKTDVKTFWQFLRMIGKEHHIVLWPLGGAQMINGGCELELQEITRITENVSALIDSERVKKGEKLDENRQDFLDVCNKLGIKAHALERRAIENYLTEKALQRAKSDKYHALKPYEKLEESDLPWAKHENWRIAREMKFEDIRNTDLGSFLESL